MYETLLCHDAACNPAGGFVVSFPPNASMAWPSIIELLCTAESEQGCFVTHHSQ